MKIKKCLTDNSEKLNVLYFLSILYIMYYNTRDRYK